MKPTVSTLNFMFRLRWQLVYLRNFSFTSMKPTVSTLNFSKEQRIRFAGNGELHYLFLNLLLFLKSFHFGAIFAPFSSYIHLMSSK